MKKSYLFFFLTIPLLLFPFIFAHGATQTITPSPLQRFQAAQQAKSLQQTSKTFNFSSSVRQGLRNSPGAVSNQVNLEAFLNKIREAGAGDPNTEKIIAQIKMDVATTTDLMGSFLRQANLVVTNIKVSESNSLKEKIISFFSFLKPKEALAVTSLPFGGPLLYTYPCTCNPSSWLIYVGPTSSLATSNMLLDYTLGSQAFLNYNLPYTTKVLGKYVPGLSACLMYVGISCTLVPGVYGKITPMVGSSGI